LESLVQLWRYAAGLKIEERRGWKRLGLKRVESVADHSLGLALLAMLESERRSYDVGTVLKLALIHDLEEAITGDLTPQDKKLRGGERVRSEKQRAITQLIKSLPTESQGSYQSLWTDLQRSRTKEARLVHELDKLEMALQASTYAKTVGHGRVRDFYRSAERGIKDPALRRLLRSVTSGS
jgi:putative hydrolase of HD superfamily